MKLHKLFFYTYCYVLSLLWAERGCLWEIFLLHQPVINGTGKEISKLSNCKEHTLITKGNESFRSLNKKSFLQSIKPSSRHPLENSYANPLAIIVNTNIPLKNSISIQFAFALMFF